jgi:hypothetical protein
MDGLTRALEDCFNTDNINAAYYASYIDRARGVLDRYYNDPKHPLPDITDQQALLNSARDAFEYLSTNDNAATPAYNYLLQTAVLNQPAKNLPANIPDRQGDANDSQESSLGFTPDIENYEMRKNGDNLEISISFYNPLPENPNDNWKGVVEKRNTDPVNNKAVIRFLMKTAYGWFKTNNSQGDNVELTARFFSNQANDGWDVVYNYYNHSTYKPPTYDGTDLDITGSAVSESATLSDDRKKLTVLIPLSGIGDRMRNHPEEMYSAIQIFNPGEYGSNGNWLGWKDIDYTGYAKIDLSGL